MLWRLRSDSRQPKFCDRLVQALLGFSLLAARSSCLSSTKLFFDGISGRGRIGRQVEQFCAPHFSNSLPHAVHLVAAQICPSPPASPGCNFGHKHSFQIGQEDFPDPWPLHGHWWRSSPRRLIRAQKWSALSAAIGRSFMGCARHRGSVRTAASSAWKHRFPSERSSFQWDRGVFRRTLHGVAVGFGMRSTHWSDFF